MKKLKLDLDAIQVEQFQAGSLDGEEGTVQALYDRTVNGTCPPAESCNTSPYQICRCQ